MNLKSLRKEVPKGRKDYVFGNKFRDKVRPIKQFILKGGKKL